MPAPTLGDYLRSFLVAEGLVRVPRVAGPDSVYPLWLAPPDGARPPHHAELDGSVTVESNPDLVISAYRVQGRSVGRNETWHVFQNIELQFRGRTYPIIEDFYNRLRTRFVDKNQTEAKRAWSMAGLYVIESLIERELEPLDITERGEASSGVGIYVYTFTAELAFELYQT